MHRRNRAAPTGRGAGPSPLVGPPAHQTSWPSSPPRGSQRPAAATGRAMRLPDGPDLRLCGRTARGSGPRRRPERHSRPFPTAHLGGSHALGDGSLEGRLLLGQGSGLEASAGLHALGAAGAGGLGGLRHHGGLGSDRGGHGATRSKGRQGRLWRGTSFSLKRAVPRWRPGPAMPPNGPIAGAAAFRRCPESLAERPGQGKYPTLEPAASRRPCRLCVPRHPTGRPATA